MIWHHSKHRRSATRRVLIKYLKHFTITYHLIIKTTHDFKPMNTTLYKLC